VPYADGYYRGGPYGSAIATENDKYLNSNTNGKDQ
jgi:hypothetical protein